MAPYIFVLIFFKAEKNINEQVSWVTHSTRHTVLSPFDVLIHWILPAPLWGGHIHAVLSQRDRKHKSQAAGEMTEAGTYTLGILH